MLRPLLAAGLAAGLAFLAAPPAFAGPPEIDYSEFRRIANEVEPYRQTRLIDWQGFLAASSNPDVLAFHEAFADIVALLQHFTIPQVLEYEISRTRGNIESESLLGSLAVQFGQAIGGRGALRDAIGRLIDGKWVRFDPDPTELERRITPHARGAILVAAVFWTMLWGPLGLLMSTPLTVCLVVLGRHVPQLGFFDVLLGDEPALDPEVKFYQRLLARDPEEATELAEEFLEEGSLEKLYDSVILPALGHAEQDRLRGALDRVDSSAELEAFEVKDPIRAGCRVFASGLHRGLGTDGSGTPHG